MAKQEIEILVGSGLSRRTVIRLVAGAGAGIALGGAAGRRLTFAQDDAPADAAEDQTLRLGSGSTGVASFTFTPLQGGGDQQNWQTLQWVPPMYFDVDLNLQPGVFSAWESNADGTEWTFTLDPRAQFSDGSPITAADVKGTWEVMADPLTEHGRIVGYIGNVAGFTELREGGAEEISGLEAVDAQTLRVTLVNPDPAFNQRIATTHMNPVKAEQAKADPAAFWRPENTPAVSGPYVLSAYDPDAGTAELGPNPNWWMDEGPYLDRIEFTFVPDQQVLGALVQNGEIDASLAGLPIEQMAAAPAYFRPIKAFGFNTFWFNVANAPTDELAVRKALTLAVNFDDVFKAAYPISEGVANPTTQVVDRDLPCFDPELGARAFDPEAAKAALAESSYGSADRLPKLRVTPRGENAVLQRALETIIEAWRQNLGIVNVEFKTQPDEFGPDVDKVNVSRDDVVIRFPDTATYVWAAGHSAGPIASVQANPAGNMLGGYQNEALDAAADEALTLAPDDPRRCELALEAARLFMDDYTALPFAEEILTLNASDYVVGYVKGPDATLIEPWKIYIQQH